jgi:beta-lactamase regulating signal transducer with metallopeptidase domain
MLILLLIVPLMGILLLLPIREEVLTRSNLSETKEIALTINTSESNLINHKDDSKPLNLELKETRRLMKQIALITCFINLFISIVI